MNKNNFKSVSDRFIKYAKVDTQSDENSNTFPSTEKQKNLGRILLNELKDLGIKSEMDEENGYVYGWIPSNIENENDERNKKTIAFISHMDTSPSFSGENVNPKIIRKYNGEIIELGHGLVLDPKEFPLLNNLLGQDLITTDGSTLLGADDKAGIAEIMTMAEYFMNNSDIEHGPIAICFTPDEEIGVGVDKIDLDKLNADFAYTVDGDILGGLEYENFNAASGEVLIKGKSVHPGSAKGVMINAGDIAVEFASSMPSDQVPQKTEGYEGFISLQEIKGDVSEAHLSYIIRDHDMEKFEEKKSILKNVEVKLNEKYGQGCVSVKIEDSYYNMKEKVEPHMFLIEKVKETMEEMEIEPRISPIRGGTDGAKLSYMGLPTPNLCTGGMNFHGPYELVSIDAMEKISELLVRLASNIFKN